MGHPLKGYKWKREDIEKRGKGIKKAHAKKEWVHKIPKCPKCGVFMGKNHRCKDVKRKQSEAKKGKEPWNKNKKLHYDVWNKGKGESWWFKHKQAREIVEKHLGRKLDRKEIVHHINEDWKDNSLRNLQVCSFPEHMRIHKELKKRRKEKSL